MIKLTSFVEVALLRPPWKQVSGSRFAPHGAATDYPVAEWMQPLYPTGGAIRLRDFQPEPLEGYRAFMLNLYRDRYVEVKTWCDRSRDYDKIAVACWCPFTRKAKQQLGRYGSFHCHLDVVSTVLEAMGIEWELGGAHEKNMVRG